VNKLRELPFLSSRWRSTSLAVDYNATPNPTTKMKKEITERNRQRQRARKKEKSVRMFSSHVFYSDPHASRERNARLKSKREREREENFPSAFVCCLLLLPLLFPKKVNFYLHDFIHRENESGEKEKEAMCI
jgi:hypothetical protein